MNSSKIAMIEGLPDPIHTGKVRVLYDAGKSQPAQNDASEGQLIMLATDRISAFDVVLPSPIPEKGKILTALSLWWFERIADLVPNHVISVDVDSYPDPFCGRDELRQRSILVRQLDMVMIECVARAYLSGSGTRQYRASRQVCGVCLPAGLEEGSHLQRPIFTPTTKGGVTGHDEPMTLAEVESVLGHERAAELRRLTIAILQRGRQICERRGILVADTKVEFGVAVDGTLTLADEVLTPDSSRFWPADEWRPGRSQPSFDKQPLRDWLEASGWDKRAPGPDLPEAVVEATRQRYVIAYERITGERWT
jgi:phosphoribosylaminoimidazole-succinocarboxamide synthase